LMAISSFGTEKALERLMSGQSLSGSECRAEPNLVLSSLKIGARLARSTGSSRACGNTSVNFAENNIDLHRIDHTPTSSKNPKMLAQTRLRAV